MVTRAWKYYFLEAKVFHIESASLDHAAIFINLGVKVICYADLFG